MQKLVCRSCDEIASMVRGEPSRVYVCPECGCGWNNDPWGRHGLYTQVARAVIVNAIAIALAWVLTTRGWGFVSTLVAVAGFLFIVQVGSWVRSWLEDVYDPPEDPR